MLLAIGLLHGCTQGASAEGAAKDMAAAMNAADVDGLWKLVSFESREQISQQLKNNQDTVPGRRLLRSLLSLDDAAIDGLTPEAYFGLLMKADPGFGKIQIEIVGVDAESDTAKAYYKRGDVEGVTRMVKEQGQWRMIVDVE
jgi:hypothetical protein